MVVRAVLWDADGVLQRLPGFDDLWGFLAEDVRLALLADTFADMPGVLTGRVDMDRRLDRVLVEHGLDADDAAAVRGTWSELPAVEESRALVAGLRERGVVCVLATNQDDLRERHMRPIYEPLMDRCYFSSAMGVAKPSTGYFEHIAADLGLPVGELLFVDDSPANVEGARSAGLLAECWHHDHGIVVLEEMLAGHGLALD